MKKGITIVDHYRRQRDILFYFLTEELNVRRSTIAKKLNIHRETIAQQWPNRKLKWRDGRKYFKKFSKLGNKARWG